MEIRPINKELEQLFHQIRHRIRRLQNGKGLDSLERIGADTQGQVGASYISLKTLSRNYPRNLELALLLWGTQRREEQILACFLLPPSLAIKEKITQLLSLCFNFEIAEYFGTLVLSKREDLEEIVDEFLESGVPYLQVAALTAIARNRIEKKLNTPFSANYIQNIASKIGTDKYVRLIFERLRSGVNIE
ncbi:hypothetical protein [Gabonibacter massiliensis]|uniref:hypothetical protein n=1 Tax=Gabonibacter massiliensis TaxID=1720195 RepID=UPI00073EF08C|nr:hypothetical protein [Gabonibacter massiliensis]